MALTNCLSLAFRTHALSRLRICLHEISIQDWDQGWRGGQKQDLGAGHCCGCVENQKIEQDEEGDGQCAALRRRRPLSGVLQSGILEDPANGPEKDPGPSWTTTPFILSCLLY